uniref:Uncharacterized protein n=1 Tax=Neogobius melanostomus TaxID=47308 RepID=A0A8C6U8P0_9GOBI
MDQDQSEMESRLNDVLSRIAMETQEIKELEQQLTDGQILANEALKRDLEGVISGLQQYLKSLRAQTSKAQVNAQNLQAENQSLRRHLKDTQRHYRRLEEQATAHTQLMTAQQDDLSVLHSEAASLRDGQVHMEAELQHLREELDRQSDQCLLQQTIRDLQTRLERFTSETPDHSSSLRVEDLSRSKSQALDQSLSEGRYRNLHRLNRKVQELRRVMCETESLTGEQRLWAVHRVKELNCSVERLKGRLEDGEARSELTEVQAEVDRARTKTRTESRCKAGAETRLRTRPEREEAPRSRAPVRLTTVSVGSGATLDSGLDLHLLSSPERAKTTGAAGNWHYRTRGAKEQHHHQHQHHLTETDPSEEGGSTEAEPAGGAHTQDEKKRLRAETEKLQRALRKHRRVLGVCEEVWCVEQTLMKRRAELREAQRLLQEAHSSIAKARHEAEEWARRAKDSATCLQRTQLQLR